MKKEALLCKKIKDNLIQCTCCSHYCVIKNNEFGKCSIRQNIDGKLYLLTYGQALGLNIDPIEKKPLYHFLPGEKVFSFGTAGCNFTCDFCQNYSLSQINFKNTPSLYNMGVNLPPQKAIDYCLENNIKNIAFTYNEPTVFFEYTLDIMKLAKKNNIKNIYVSNGFQTKEFWQQAKNYIDAINIDLKGFSDKFYKEVCGGKLNPILENIKYVYNKTNVFLELTTLIIPGENDSQENLEEIAKFISSISKDIPWHISAFHPDYKMTNTPATPYKTLLKAYEIGKKEGLNYIYLGNILDPKHSSTYCPKCKKLLIERNGYVGEQVKTYFKEPGVCPNCETKIPGLWK